MVAAPWQAAKDGGGRAALNKPGEGGGRGAPGRYSGNLSCTGSHDKRKFNCVSPGSGFRASVSVNCATPELSFIPVAWLRPGLWRYQPVPVKDCLTTIFMPGTFDERGAFSRQKGQEQVPVQL